uniref:Leucine-rich repeat-containing N-terminal plant-type domain-containing protein n=1 Tax=Oryza rufipogon TaxID=4529 RepID=A0A0E0NHS9_ORYRU
MAIQPKSSSCLIPCLLLLSCIAAMEAKPNSPELDQKSNQQNHVSYKPQPQDFPNERLYRSYLVIQRFKHTITCDPKNITATWTGYDICGKTSYRGFYCTTTSYGQDKKQLTITAVVFDGFGLCAPKLQGFVDKLPDVALFQADSNCFGGDIPFLGGLAYKYKFNIVGRKDGEAHFSYDEAKYPIVTAMINIGGIKINLMVSRSGSQKRVGMANAMTGKAMLINDNKMIGLLPANLSFSTLSYLAVANNRLTGSIPPSIAQAKDSLLELLLLNNQLSGCLPHELGMLTKAAVIDAGMNQLTGPIPSSFSCLTSVEQLNLGGNRLYGEIPDALCKLAAGPAGRLANLTLSSNYFTSVGPACLSLIKDSVLNVKNNCIPGFANQRRPAECASFLSQPKTCPAASATHVGCPAGAANAAAAAADRVAKDYSSYVTYATLHNGGRSRLAAAGPVLAFS